MRKYSVLLTVALIALAAMSCSAADVTGKWKTSFETQNGSMELVYTFKQEGTKLTGNFAAAQGDPIEILDGKVEGDKISFSFVFGQNATKILTEGTVSAEEIKLTVKIGDQEPRTFVLKKA